MEAYLAEVRKMEKQFLGLELQHVPRGTNKEADDIAKRASRRLPQEPGIFEERLFKPSAAPPPSGSTAEEAVRPWRASLHQRGCHDLGDSYHAKGRSRGRGGPRQGSRCACGDGRVHTWAPESRGPRGGLSPSPRQRTSSMAPLVSLLSKGEEASGMGRDGRRGLCPLPIYSRRRPTGTPHDHR